MCNDSLSSMRNVLLRNQYTMYILNFFASEKMTVVPNRLANHMSRKQYLHATNLLVETVNLGKGTLDGVESLKELSLELEQKKEVRETL